MRNQTKRQTLMLFAAAMLVAGLTALLYPAASGAINARNQSRVIQRHDEALSGLGEETRAAMLEAARGHNRLLEEKPDRHAMTGGEMETYLGMLDAAGNGVMGHVEIASIGVRLPIYHGTGEAALRAGAGHLEWSSLPVGGPGTHAVLTAHSGLPESRLFTDLNRLDHGDVFVLRVLGEELAYRVDRILTVLPDDVSGLEIESGMDHATLITCTPYGVNSHRLLVRGVRVPGGEAGAGNGFPGASASFRCACILLLPLVILSLAVSLVSLPVIAFALTRQGRKENG